MKPERIPKSNPTWNPTETQKKFEIKPLRDVNLQRIPIWNPNSFVLFSPVCILNETLKTNAMQCNVMQCNAMHCNVTQWNVMQCNAMQCYAMHCNVTQWNVMQCNAMLCNAMQCNATQWNAMQCNAMQCNAMQSGGSKLQASGFQKGPFATAKQHLIACRNRAQTYPQKLPNAPSEFLEKTLSLFFCLLQLLFGGSKLQASGFQKGPFATAKQHLIACRNRAQTYPQKLPNAPSEFLEEIYLFFVSCSSCLVAPSCKHQASRRDPSPQQNST